MKQGWPSRIMYFVQRGAVMLVQDGVAIELIGPGQFFGGEALLRLPNNEQLQQVCLSCMRPSPACMLALLHWALALGGSSANCKGAAKLVWAK